MSRRAHRRWMLGFNAFAWAAPAVTLVAGILWLPSVPPWKPPNRSHEANTTQLPTTRPTLAADQLAVIWQRDLRQALVDPAPAAPPPEPTLSVRLVGTAIEAEHRFGLFQLANSATVIKPVGAKVDGLEIVAIERGLARLRGGSREYELRVPWYERLQASTRE